MDTDQLNKWLALVANLGVVAGIIFLALEIRQSSSVATAANDIALRQMHATLNESVYGDAQLAKLLFKARDPKTEFSGAELEMMYSYVARMFNSWGAYERADRAGLASSDAMGAMIDDIHAIVSSYPGLRPVFSEHVGAYPGYSDSIVYQTVRELVEDSSEADGQ